MTQRLEELDFHCVTNASHTAKRVFQKVDFLQPKKLNSDV